MSRLTNEKSGNLPPPVSSAVFDFDQIPLFQPENSTDFEVSKEPRPAVPRAQVARQPRIEHEQQLASEAGRRLIKIEQSGLIPTGYYSGAISAHRHNCNERRVHRRQESIRDCSGSVAKKERSHLDGENTALNGL